MRGKDFVSAVESQGRLPVTKGVHTYLSTQSDLERCWFTRSLFGRHYGFSPFLPTNLCVAISTSLPGRPSEGVPLPVEWFKGTVRYLYPRSAMGGGRCEVPACHNLGYVAIKTATGRVQTCLVHFQMVREATGLRR